MSPFEDVRDLIRAQPPVTLPSDSPEDAPKSVRTLGRLAEVGEWVAACQRKDSGTADRPTVAIFAGAHGLQNEGVSVSVSNATEQRVKALQAGETPTNGLAARVNATVRVFELAIEKPTNNIAESPAMTEKECAATIAFGMEALTSEPDCLALGVLGVGGGTAAAAVAAGLYGGDSRYWVRAGAGVPEEVNARRTDIVSRAISHNRGHLDDPLEVLRRLGGREIAACVGAIIAARHQGVPVIIDGFATAVAAGVVHALHPAGIDHIIAGQVTDRPAHKALLDRLDKTPLVDFGLQQGEGLGSTLAIGILQAACAARSLA